MNIGGRSSRARPNTTNHSTQFSTPPKVLFRHHENFVTYTDPLILLEWWSQWRLRWAGHAARMGKIKIHVKKHFTRRPFENCRVWIISLFEKINIKWIDNLGLQNTECKKNHELWTEIFRPRWSWSIWILVPIMTWKDRDRQSVQKNRYSGRTLTAILESTSPERHDYTNMISAAEVGSVNGTWTDPAELRCEDVKRTQKASFRV